MQGYLPSPPLRMPVTSVSVLKSSVFLFGQVYVVASGQGRAAVPMVCGRCAKLPNCYGLVQPG